MDIDVALSFAGEDREYVDQVAGHLYRAGVSVFYDKYEQVDLWGKDLYEHLSDVYQNKARFTVMFVSCHYAEKLWPRHERRNAQARAFQESREYILPARFDDTEVSGLPPTIGYLDLRHYSPVQLADAVCEKLVRSGVALLPEPTRPSSSAEEAVSPTHVTITVQDEQGEPVPDADILLIAANGTHLRRQTNEAGEAQFKIPKRRTLTIFCAHPTRPAFVGPEFDPVRDLRVMLPTIEGVGSFISLDGWHAFPSLGGSIAPIHDSSKRLYLYTKNLAVDGGKPQPVSFEIGKSLHFEDSNGNERYVTFVGVIARCYLVEHRAVVSVPGLTKW